MTSASPPTPPPLPPRTFVSSQSTMTESNPYFLSTGDNPGIVLVSQPLYGNNYPTWSRSMLMALNAKNKVGFVTGAIAKPSTSDPNFAVWTRCNDIVISWILNSISRELASSIIYIESTKDIWSDLKDRFSQGNGPRVFQLQKAISILSLSRAAIGQ